MAGALTSRRGRDRDAPRVDPNPPPFDVEPALREQPHGEREEHVLLLEDPSRKGLGRVVVEDRDGLDELSKGGIAAVAQPGGSIRDSEVIAAADEHGIAMAFTGLRLFKH